MTLSCQLFFFPSQKIITDALCSKQNNTCGEEDNHLGEVEFIRLEKNKTLFSTVPLTIEYLDTQYDQSFKKKKIYKYVNTSLDAIDREYIFYI